MMPKRFVKKYGIWCRFYQNRLGTNEQDLMNWLCHLNLCLHGRHINDLLSIFIYIRKCRVSHIPEFHLNQGVFLVYR